MNKRYHVVFTGELVPGMDPERVKSNLIIDLGLTDSQVSELMTRGRVLLKRFSAAGTAQAMLEQLKNIGLVCVVEDHNPQSEVEADSGESSLVMLMHKFIPVSRGEKQKRRL